MRVYVRPAFYHDLEREQLWLLENAGAAVADRWFNAVWETISFLKSWPEAGRLRKDLAFEGIRSWRVSRFHRWIIFYELSEHVIVLNRITSGMMNLPSMPLD
jgi:plasmid stabilization system protein ParE